MSEKRVTIHDIARKLNITASTVSRALNNHSRISKKTKDEVKKVAEKMNYHPNVIAHNLRKGKANTIGLVVPRINRQFFADAIHGIEQVTNPAGYNLIICQSGELYQKEHENINTLLNNRVDGIIISVSFETEYSDHLQGAYNRGIPLLQFDRICSDMEVNNVVNDNFGGAYEAVSHIIEQGYRRIIHFAGPLHISIYKERFLGYKKALEDYGIRFDERLVYHETITKEKGTSAAKDILMHSGIPKPDAIFSAGDYSALGAMLVLKENGVEIPRQMGIAGVANEPFTSLIDPGLTSVEQYSVTIGEKAAHLLLEEIADDSRKKPRTQVIKPSLIKRKSTQK